MEKSEEKEEKFEQKPTDGVLYSPGEEPENIKMMLQKLFEKLDATYPDKFIFKLSSAHKNLAEKVTDMYRMLGYSDGRTFLETYGYQVQKNGRSGTDPMIVINELKRRYPNGSGFTNRADLIAANPDLKPKFQNLSNQSNKFFGMTLNEYLITEGILAGKKDKQYIDKKSVDEFKTLKARYADKAFIGRIGQLREINSDLDWKAIEKYIYNSKSSETMSKFLENHGIIATTEQIQIAELAEITSKLKERYPENKKFTGTVKQLQLENPDLSTNTLSYLVSIIHNETLNEYLIRMKIMDVGEQISEKLNSVMEKLIERYPARKRKEISINRLQINNPDLPINKIGSWCQKLYNQNATEFLKANGILYKRYNFQARRSCEKRRESENNSPQEKSHGERNQVFETSDHTTHVFYADAMNKTVEEMDLHRYADGECFNERENQINNCGKHTDANKTGNIENNGVCALDNLKDQNDNCTEFEIKSGVLYKYLGREKDVVIPDEVTSVKTEAFLEAYHVETITFPDTVRTIGNELFGFINDYYQNHEYKLRKIFIGNGVKSIGERAFANCKNLTDVVFGKSISRIGERAFAGCTKLREIDLGNTVVKEIKECAFCDCFNVEKLILPPKIEFIGTSAFANSCNGTVKLPKSVQKVNPYAFCGASELIAYDSIDPGAAEAGDWQYNEKMRNTNSSLICSMFDNSYSNEGFFDYSSTEWCNCYVTVLSSATDKIRYRIFCDGEEKGAYRAMMYSAWGKHASFLFEQYDNYFVYVRSQKTRLEMAFCRLQYPEGLSEQNRSDYTAYLKQCMYIESSARRNAEIIGAEDAVERLAILKGLGAIDEHNLGWIKEIIIEQNAQKCMKFIIDNF